MTINNALLANAAVNALATSAVARLETTLTAFALMRVTAALVQQSAVPAAGGPAAAQGFALGGCCPCVCYPGLPTPVEPAPGADPWTATMPQDGRASVDLGDGYTLEINERRSQMIIRDGDGNETDIWGDPHVDVNGQRIGDFYDTTTFELENGTKITINTEPWRGNPNAYVASQVIVTKGDQALVIDGISQNDLGDLAITLGQNGRALDFAHDDGLNLFEQDLGNGDYGWVSEFTGERATRADFDLTRHANRAEREALEFSRDFTQAAGAWLLFGDIGALLSFASSETGERAIRDVAQSGTSPFIEAALRNAGFDS